MIYVLILASKVRETCSFIKLNKRFKLDKTTIRTIRVILPDNNRTVWG